MTSIDTTSASSEAVLAAAAEVVNNAPSPIDEFVTEAYDLIEKWESRGAEYDEFVNHPKVAASRVGAMELVIADMRAHLAAMEDPEKVTGSPIYGPRQLLADLRHLRELNKTLVREGVEGSVFRRVSSPRTKIRWAIALVEGTEAGAKEYSAEIDKFAYKLAVAIKVADANS